jgi:nucleotide-binding universal stress UspA family protein
MTPGPVIIAFDGTRVGGRAIREAAAILRPHETIVLVVREPGMAAPEYPGIDVRLVPIDPADIAEADAAANANARLVAAHGADLARQAGLDAEPVVAVDEGTVGGTIVRVAAERHAAAIVVGAHRYGRVGRIVIGSTSRQVLQDAPCPVLVVRPGGD